MGDNCILLKYDYISVSPLNEYFTRILIINKSTLSLFFRTASGRLESFEMTPQSMIEDSLLPAPTPEIVAAPPLNGSPRERTPPARASEPSIRPLVSQLRRVYRRLSRASVSRPPPREVPTLSSLAQAVNPPDVVVPPSTNAAGTQEGAGIPFGPPRVPEPGTVRRGLLSGVDKTII